MAKTTRIKGAANFMAIFAKNLVTAEKAEPPLEWMARDALIRCFLQTLFSLLSGLRFLKGFCFLPVPPDFLGRLDLPGGKGGRDELDEWAEGDEEAADEGARDEEAADEGARDEDAADEGACDEEEGDEGARDEEWPR